MKIGLLSDTHGFLDEKIFSYFAHVDEIWHAGDIGAISLLHELNNFKPTVAVYGNIDDTEMQSAAPENHLLEREGLKILMTHIAGKPPTYNQRVKKLINEYEPGLLICGHSHILKVQADPVHHLLYMNPGAAGIHGFHQVKTLLRFDIEAGKPKNLEVIELGKRGALK